jgi:hypothetical protein
MSDSQQFPFSNAVFTKCLGRGIDIKRVRRIIGLVFGWEVFSVLEYSKVSGKELDQVKKNTPSLPNM